MAPNEGKSTPWMDHMTRPPPLDGFGREQIEFWTWLGWFIGQFSQLEAMMQRFLWHYAGVSAEIAKVLFSSVKVDGAIDRIRHILSEGDFDDFTKDAANTILGQLTVINTVRSDIVHYGAHFIADPETFRETDLLVTSERITKKTRNPRETVISSVELYKMGEDINKACALMYLLTNYGHSELARV